MCPAPSHALPSRLRNLPFVGREDELQVFENMLWPAVPSMDYQVLSMYGVGGQGKTTLLDRFARRLSDPDCSTRPLVRLDVAITSHRDAVDGLFTVRNQLRAARVATHAFDMAFARHFALTRPGRDLTKDYPELFRFKEDSIFGELVDIGVEAADYMPGAGLAVSLLARLSNKVSAWYRTRGVDVLEQLNEIGAQKVADSLPMFLGYDIAAFLRDHPQRRPVLIFDTYEALWRDRPAGGAISDLGGDNWLRRFAEEAKGCLFVIAGRRRVAWKDIDPTWAPWIVSLPLDALGRGAVDAMLDAGRIDASDVRKALKDAAEGHPLSLAVGIRYCQMRQLAGAAVTAPDVPRTHREILDRFFDHLEPGMRNVLRTLAVPTHIRRELWEFLISQRMPAFDGYLASDVFQEVIFRQASPDVYDMHEKVRDHLIADLEARDPSHLESARLAVFDFYDRASSADASKREGAHVPDLSLSLKSRDECLAEAAMQVRLASPRKFVQWCLERFNARGSGSNLRRSLLDQAFELIGAIDSDSLGHAAKLAHLRLRSDPWSTDGINLLQGVVDMVSEEPAGAELLQDLRNSAFNLIRANPSAVPPRLLQIVCAHPSARESAWWPCLEIEEALLREDVGSAMQFAKIWLAEQTKPIIQDELFVVLRAIAVASDRDACSTLCKELAFQERDWLWSAYLARIVDSFNLLGAPALSILAAETGMGASGQQALSEQILANKFLSPYHQVILGLVESYLHCGDKVSALGILSFPGINRMLADLAEQTNELPPTSAYTSIETEIWRKLADSIEATHGLQGFCEGYVGAALAVGHPAMEMMSASVRERIRLMLKRLDDQLGGQPTYATNRKKRLEFVVNDRGEVMWFKNDPLFCWRCVDSVKFSHGDRIMFCDAREGKSREFSTVLRKPLADLIAEGAVILVVDCDDDGKPVEGRYIEHYGAPN